jgi:hypothetical protein
MPCTNGERESSTALAKADVERRIEAASAGAQTPTTDINISKERWLMCKSRSVRLRGEAASATTAVRPEIPIDDGDEDKEEDDEEEEVDEAEDNNFVRLYPFDTEMLLKRELTVDSVWARKGRAACFKKLAKSGMMETNISASPGTRSRDAPA